MFPKINLSYIGSQCVFQNNQSFFLFIASSLHQPWALYYQGLFKKQPELYWFSVFSKTTPSFVCSLCLLQNNLELCLFSVSSPKQPSVLLVHNSYPIQSWALIVHSIFSKTIPSFHLLQNKPELRVVIKSSPKEPRASSNHSVISKITLLVTGFQSLLQNISSTTAKSLHDTVQCLLLAVDSQINMETQQGKQPARTWSVSRWGPRDCRVFPYSTSQRYKVSFTHLPLQRRK
jgi:hypothetical protein